MVSRDQRSAQPLARRPVSFRLLLALGGLAVFPATTASAAPQFEEIQRAIQEHVQAGEFGPALTQALSVKDPEQQTQLLQEIAAAQTDSGESQGAASTLRRISNPRDRAQGMRQNSALRGGGAQFNPAALMNLIRNNAGDEEDWDVDGSRQPMSPFQLGVRVSPGGVLERITAKEQSRTLAELGLRARQADLNRDLARSSELRMVSLTRLDQELAEHLANGRSVPASMAFLAGITKVQYIFVFPETGEIVIGGPAEGWEYNAVGQAVGRESHAPTLQLDDFVTVFRTFASGAVDFGCSINTRDDNVKAVMEYAAASLAKGPLNAGSGVKGFVNQIQNRLGRQDIVIWGVPADSRVARVIVEADYRMKLAGVDRLDTAKDVPSYFDLLPQELQKNPAPMEALRWWLTMKYDAVLHNSDKSVYEIQGASVLCQSENQLLTAEGKHLPTGKSEGVNRMFAEQFTASYEKLAQRDLVFADARNVFDLALVAALINKENLAAKANHEFQAFSQGGLYHPASYAVPKQVASVVNHRVYNGRDIVVQAAGGVRADLLSVLENPKTVQAAPELDSLASTVNTPERPEGRWWWDVAR